MVREWPSTEGEIVSGEIAAKLVRPFAFGRPSSSRYRYSANIRYRYTVEGKKYVSGQISLAKNFDRFLDTFSGRGDAAYEGTWLAKYPVGKKVLVYFDPDDPSNALLERDEAALAYLFFAGAGVLAFLGLSILKSVRHQRSESHFG